MLDARRQGATSEAYIKYAARRGDRRLRRELSRTSTQPFDFAQDRELVERPAEWQMTSRWWIRAIAAEVCLEKDLTILSTGLI